MEQVSEHALGIAEVCGATVHTLYVVDETAYQTIPDDVREQVRDTLTDDGESATKAITQRALESKIETRREIRWGDPTAAIIAYAVENEIDIIVMGTRGKTGFERYMLGSVAEKVVRSSPMPVLTVHIGDTDELMADIQETLGT